MCARNSADWGLLKRDSSSTVGERGDCCVVSEAVEKELGDSHFDILVLFLSCIKKAHKMKYTK